MHAFGADFFDLGHARGAKSSSSLFTFDNVREEHRRFVFVTLFALHLGSRQKDSDRLSKIPTRSAQDASD